MPARRLVLLRHAEAGDAATDRDRPLTGRGEVQAAAVGAWLAQTAPVLDRVLVSPARRARQTWDLAGASLERAADPVEDDRIYDNTVEALFEVLRETSDDVATLAVVGHNPSVGLLVRLLDDGQGTPEAERHAVEGFPPGAVAVFDVPTPFGALDEGGATLVDVVVPGG